MKKTGLQSNPEFNKSIFKITLCLTINLPSQLHVSLTRKKFCLMRNDYKIFALITYHFSTETLRMCQFSSPLMNVSYTHFTQFMNQFNIQLSVGHKRKCIP